jgi:hypothetical protein
MKLAMTLGVVLISAPARADEKPKHQDQWMFDTQPITATTPSAGKTTFAMTDHIYSRVFFDKPIKEVFNLTDTDYAFVVYEKLSDSGTIYDNVETWVSKHDFEHHYLDIDILPDPAKATTKYDHARGFAYAFINGLKNDHADQLRGKHQVFYSISRRSKDNDERAAVVTIDFTGIDQNKLESEAKLVGAAGDKAFASNFALPRPGRMHTAALGKQAEAMTKQANHDLVAVKVVFTSDEWTIERNDVTGIITGRIAEASLVMKEKAGNCLLDSGVIRQDYIHGKFKAPGEWENTASTPNQIDCKKAFK